MPSRQSKRVFLGGLDRDTDPRLLKNGDYHHALNIRNVSSESNTEGMIENIKGNVKQSYTFPTPASSGKRRITLFMPWFNYFYNYGGSGIWWEDNQAQDILVSSSSGNVSLLPDGFNGQLLSGQYVGDNPDSNTFGYIYDFPQIYGADPTSVTGADSQTYQQLGGPHVTLLTFDIAVGFSLAEMSNPTQRFQISYNGETATNMFNYLTYFVQHNSDAFASLGLSISVINNNSPYFDNEYFFGQSVMNNITSHPNYTPGQIWAYALLIEGAIESNDAGQVSGEFYVDLKQPEVGLGQSIISQGASESITGSLFSNNSSNQPAYFWAPQDTAVDDGPGYATNQVLDESQDWTVVGSSDGPLVLTEYLNGMETAGWDVGVGFVDASLHHGPVQMGKKFIRANATMYNDIVDVDKDNITYDTIGAYEDTQGDKIYWMVANNYSYHLILEYDLKTGAISTVFRDCGDPESSVFNWRSEFLINDINKIGDVLYWTSRQYGEPCSINVRKSKNSIALIDSSTDPYILDEEGGTDNITLEDHYPYNLYNAGYPKELKRQYVEVIKRPPLYAPVYEYDNDTNYSKNNLFGYMWQFRYRYHFYDNEVSAWSPISDITPSKWDTINLNQTNITPGDNNVIKLSVKNSSGIVKKIEIAGRKCKDLGFTTRGNRGPYFSVAELDNDFSAWQLDNDSEQEISFYNDQMYPQVLAGEGERLFDSVPRSAHTQAILGNNRLAYANYTEGFDVPKVSLSVNPQYGHHSGSGKGGYGGADYENPVTELTGQGVSSFKSGAFHSFGIIYYDKKGRCSTVLVDDTSRCYVKFPTERNVSADIPSDVSEYDLYGAVTMKWEINHKAPDWASHYRWAYSKNNTVDEFIQFRVLQAFTNQDPASSDNRIFINLRGLKGSDDSYIGVGELDDKSVPEPPVNILDYEFLKGDRLRIITSGTQTTANFPANETVLTTYYDIKISGFEYYSYLNPKIPIRDSNGINALNTDGSEDGWYIIVEEILDTDGNVITDYASSDAADNSDLFEQSIVEIYRPRPDAEPGEMFYYEFSELYEIDELTGRHLGPLADQGETFTEDAFGNSTSNTPATGEFLTGDVYYKERIMNMFSNDLVVADTNPSGKGNQGFYVEDYFLNDFIETNHFSIGRANIYSAFYRQQEKENSITYSDVYQPATSFNGLSTFDYNEGNWKDYAKIFGTIQKIHYRDDMLVMIFEDRTFTIPVQKDIILSADGKGTLGISDKILGPENPMTSHYGISKNPESFVADGNVLYWTDIRRGVSVRLSRDGLTAISQNKMVDFFRDKSEHYQSYDPQYKWSSNYGSIENYMIAGYHKDFRIIGGFNPKHSEYLVQFPTIFRSGTEWDEIATIYDDVNSSWSNVLDPETGQAASPNVLAVGGTLSWSERQNRWISLYSHTAEYYCKINRLFVSWDNGFLYLHDLDSDNYNTFYGITYFTELDFFINEKPSTVKGYKTITLEANKAVDSDGDGVEEAEETSYDIVLATDMTETSVNKHNFDTRENKQYAQIPFVTTNSTGSEIIGLGLGTIEDNGQTGFVQNEIVIGGTGSDFISPNIIVGTSSDPSSNNYGDQLYYLDGSNEVLVGTISAINQDAIPSLLSTNTFSVGTPQFLQINSTNQIFSNKFIFIKRNAFAEGDRMKGRYMEVKMKKRSKKLLEIFSASSTIFDSELSDD